MSTYDKAVPEIASGNNTSENTDTNTVEEKYKWTINGYYVYVRHNSYGNEIEHTLDNTKSTSQSIACTVAQKLKKFSPTKMKNAKKSCQQGNRDRCN